MRVSNDTLFPVIKKNFLNQQRLSIFRKHIEYFNSYFQTLGNYAFEKIADIPF